MKKRLRKKQHQNEFIEYGLSFWCQHPISDAALYPDRHGEMDKLVDDFIEFVERRGFACGGGWCPVSKETLLDWKFTVELRGYVGKVPPYEMALTFEWELYQWFSDRFPHFELSTSVCNLWTWEDDDILLGGVFFKGDGNAYFCPR